MESPLLSEDEDEITIKIDEDEMKDSDTTVIGIFDPEENNFNLNMWSQSDSEDVKSSIKRINKIKLSNTSSILLRD